MYKTIKSLLESEGCTECAALECRYYCEDREVNFFGCDAQADSDCPRINSDCEDYL